MIRRLCGIVMVVLAAGCGGDSYGDSSSVDQVNTPPTSGPAGHESADSVDVGTQPTTTDQGFTATPIVPATPPATAPVGLPLDPSSRLVQGAIDDLAQRLSIDRDEVTVIDSRGVTWGDTSLGCPQPGVAYLQRLMDGAVAILEAQGRRYEYHGGDPLALCENPEPPTG